MRWFRHLVKMLPGTTGRWWMELIGQTFCLIQTSNLQQTYQAKWYRQRPDHPELGLPLVRVSNGWDYQWFWGPFLKIQKYLKLSHFNLVAVQTRLDLDWLQLAWLTFDSKQFQLLDWLYNRHLPLVEGSDDGFMHWLQRKHHTLTGLCFHKNLMQIWDN